VGGTAAGESRPAFLRWLRIAELVGGTLLALSLGLGTFLYGGVPHGGYDEYGIVPVPGSQVLELPEGLVMLDHADDVEGCWDAISHIENASIFPLPKGLTVRIAAVAGGAELAVTPIPRWLYSTIANCRGHEPFGRIDVPEAGTYMVETASSEREGLSEGAGIAFGARPWAPFGSPLFAGIAVAMIAIGLVVFPIERIWARGKF
jgi:hypothetical protein